MLKMITSGMFVVGMVTVPVALSPRQAPPAGSGISQRSQTRDSAHVLPQLRLPGSRVRRSLPRSGRPQRTRLASICRASPSSNRRVENRRHTTICSGGIPDARTSPPRLPASTRSATNSPIRTDIRTRSWTSSWLSIIRTSSMDKRSSPSCDGLPPPSDPNGIGWSGVIQEGDAEVQASEKNN